MQRRPKTMDSFDIIKDSNSEDARGGDESNEDSLRISFPHSPADKPGKPLEIPIAECIPRSRSLHCSTSTSKRIHTLEKDTNKYLENAEYDGRYLASATINSANTEAECQENTVESRDNLSGVDVMSPNASFPTRLHDLLSNVDIMGLSHIVSWLPDGNSFRIHSRTAFEEQVMKYITLPRSKSFDAFQRQLKLYGFTNILAHPNGNTFEYYHEHFRRGQQSLAVHRVSRINEERGSSNTCNKPQARKSLSWTDQEDATVIQAVTESNEQPFAQWSDVAKRLPGRTGKQIRDRWKHHLDPNINHEPFSRGDDLLLWEAYKVYGKKWVEISTKCFNSTRSENQVKNRWYSAAFKRLVADEFGSDAYARASGVSGKLSKPKGIKKRRNRKKK